MSKCYSEEFFNKFTTFKGELNCVYCGERLTGENRTREHVPSKVFLVAPYPENLPVLPSCKDCNNSFSFDELYLWFAIQLLQNEFGIKMLSKEYYERSLKRENERPHNEAIAFIRRSKENLLGEIINIECEKIERILLKIAKGHIIYDLCRLYDLESMRFTYTLEYSIKPLLPAERLREYGVDRIFRGKFPDIGAYPNFHKRILIVEPLDEEGEPFFIIQPNVVQNGNYTYSAIYDENDLQGIVVKIIISDFLYVRVRFLLNNE